MDSFKETIFYTKSLRLFVFDFGRSDSGRDISFDISQRMWPSLAIAVPQLLIGLLLAITFALLIAFFRATYYRLLGSGDLCGTDVDLQPVLHHWRSVCHGQAFTGRADFRDSKAAFLGLSS